MIGKEFFIYIKTSRQVIISRGSVEVSHSRQDLSSERMGTSTKFIIVIS